MEITTREEEEEEELIFFSSSSSRPAGIFSFTIDNTVQLTFEPSFCVYAVYSR